jgi:BMFP domain-containing protein YqiC
MKHAAGGDILDKLSELERRIERLEAQLKTH